MHPSVPARNLKELIALAKARPGQLNFASSGLGSSNQMAGELFKMMASINIVHVPYKGNAPALTDTMAGHVEMMFSGVPALIPHIQSGRLRAVAIGSLKRFTAIPEVPTFDESGVKGYEATTWFGLFTTAGTPREVVLKINAEVQRLFNEEAFRKRFVEPLLYEVMTTSPDQFDDFIAAETKKWAKVIRDANLKVD
jgi:tripartite-type tricarboxylate transporter receptor subunit TctC